MVFMYYLFEILDNGNIEPINGFFFLAIYHIIKNRNITKKLKKIKFLLLKSAFKRHVRNTHGREVS